MGITQGCCWDYIGSCRDDIVAYEGLYRAI